ncbi:MAG: 16S rRNA (cytidine(1402)-2'-O)-methyltransferase [Cyclobacteriaceae bacterium]|nr:16S rRNA (cytidine(1402)-2'-O)-methyltransferase [Cyclobacteriaceae bacterium]
MTDPKTQLYLVPTPIGNLKDITLRALEILESVDAVLAEDTRTTGKLLKHFDIKKKLISYHAHNEHNAVNRVVESLGRGETLALVSDAGSPGISDPGYLVVHEVLKHGYKIEALPGATAFVPALVKSGLPSDRFVFEGFLPPKKGRQTRLLMLAEETRTIILYESPHRLLKTLNQLADHLGTERATSVSRELTKLYEETINGTLQEVTNHFENGTIKGEFVIIVKGK